MIIRESQITRALPENILRLAKYLGIKTQHRLLADIIQEISIHCRPIYTGWKI